MLHAQGCNSIKLQFFLFCTHNKPILPSKTRNTQHEEGKNGVVLTGPILDLSILLLYKYELYVLKHISYKHSLHIHMKLPSLLHWEQFLAQIKCVS